jgi:hypothetical protein
MAMLKYVSHANKAIELRYAGKRHLAVTEMSNGVMHVMVRQIHTV